MVELAVALLFGGVNDELALCMFTLAFGGTTSLY